MKDQDTNISYQNKDIVAKFFGDRMKGKSLSLFGLNTDQKVVRVAPTNIPVVLAQELRMDNVFELDDESVAIVDYESSYKEENFFKYGKYIINVSERYWHDKKKPDIHMLVIYTADVEMSKAVWHKTACDIRIEAAYLAKTDSEAWFSEAQRQIAESAVTDEAMMHLIFYPLTFSGDADKQTAIRRSVDLAKTIKDREQECFVLAGILAFTDKIISKGIRDEIKEVIHMTQIGQMLFDEGRQEGELAQAKKTAKNMFARGDRAEDIAEVLEIPVDTVKAWREEALCTV